MNKEAIEATVESLVTRLCFGLIAHHDIFRLHKVFSGGQMTTYKIECHGADFPRIVGKHGARFRALQFIAAAIGANQGRQTKLESLMPPTVGSAETWPKFQPNPNWPKDEICKLLRETCNAILHFGEVETRAIQTGDSAVIQVCYDSREPVGSIETFAENLTPIFRGIGTTSGCQLSIDFIRKN